MASSALTIICTTFEKFLKKVLEKLKLRKDLKNLYMVALQSLMKPRILYAWNTMWHQMRSNLALGMHSSALMTIYTTFEKFLKKVSKKKALTFCLMEPDLG